MMLPLLLTASLLAAPDDDVVARIGDRSFTAQELGQWMVARTGHSAVQPFVMEQMLVAEAEAEGLLPSDEELAQALADEQQFTIDRFYNGDRQAWIRDETTKGNNPALVGPRRLIELKGELCLSRLVLAAREISDEQIADAFERDYGDLEESISVEVLFFSFYSGLEPGEPRPELAELDRLTRARAEGVRRRVLAGDDIEQLLPLGDKFESDFVERGVVRTWRRNLLGVEMDGAVNSLDLPGDTSPLVKVWDGYWIVRLVERRPVTLEGMRDELIQRLMEQPITGAEQGAVRERVTQKYAPEILLK